MNEMGKLQRELLKSAFKMAVINNPELTLNQKRQTMDVIDEAAKKTDWIETIMKQCGYVK